MENNQLKIAAITDDGKTISQHFGRASHYLVITVENGQIVTRELRDKLSHAHFANEPHEHNAEHSQPHGFSLAEHDRHARMAQAIDDCQALLCRGMGAGAYYSMQERGIRPVVTDIVTIDEAVTAYVEGTIVDHIDQLH
jgi:predicted Fe-Mo cluster-binding NifX family protein